MKDDIRRAFDDLTEAPHPALRSSLRARLAAGPTRPPSRTLRLVALAAAVLLIPLIGAESMQLFSHRVPVLGLAGTPSPSSSPASSPSPTPIYSQRTVSPGACTTAAIDSPGRPVEVADVRVGTQAVPGFDRFVIEFSGTAEPGLPTYSITRQSSATFTKDPSGQTVTLQGEGGIKVVVQGVSAMSTTWSEDVRPGYPELKEALQLGYFEGVLSWGLGVAAPDGGCYNAFVTPNPMRLVIDLKQP
jgi:hypothetical protein